MERASASLADASDEKWKAAVRRERGSCSIDDLDSVTTNEPDTPLRDQNETVSLRASAYTRPHGNRGNPRDSAAVAGEWHGRDRYQLFLVRVQVPQQ